MRKFLILVCAFVVLGGCMTNPFYSTSYGSAHPSYVYGKSDGSTVFEFKFILDPFDARKAMQRIDEYLTTYAKEKGFSGYDVEVVNGKGIDKSSRGAGYWMVPAGTGFVMGSSETTSRSGRDYYGRITVQVRFKA